MVYPKECPVLLAKNCGWLPSEKLKEIARATKNWAQNYRGKSAEDYCLMGVYDFIDETHIPEKRKRVINILLGINSGVSDSAINTFIREAYGLKLCLLMTW